MDTQLSLFAESMMIPSMTERARSNVRKTVKSIPKDSLTLELKEMLHSLFKHDTGDNRAWIILAVTSIPPVSWPEFKSFALSPLTQGMNEQQYSNTVYFLSGIPYAKWNDFKALALSLMTENMGGNEREWIIRTLRKDPYEKWGELVCIVPRLNAQADKEIQARLAREPIEKRAEEELKAKLKTFTLALAHSRALKTQNTSTPNDAEPDSDLQKLHEQCDLAFSFLAEDMEPYIFFGVLSALGNTPEELWRNLQQITKALATKTMKPKHQVYVLTALGNIPTQKKKGIYSLFQEFAKTTTVQFSYWRNATYLIETVSYLETLEQAQGFMTGLIGLVQKDPLEVDERRLVVYTLALQEHISSKGPKTEEESYCPDDDTIRQTDHLLASVGWRNRFSTNKDTYSPDEPYRRVAKPARGSDDEEG